MEAHAYLLQPSSSESEDSGSNPSNKRAGPLNTKKFHRRVMEQLKGNFFRVELQFTYNKFLSRSCRELKFSMQSIMPG